jgi:hypothetical protein
MTFYSEEYFSAYCTFLLNPLTFQFLDKELHVRFVFYCLILLWPSHEEVFDLQPPRANQFASSLLYGILYFYFIDVTCILSSML